MMTVKETVESKGEQYWEPDVGKSLKCEVHPLACAGTIVVTWMNNFACTRKAQFQGNRTSDHTCRLPPPKKTGNITSKTTFGHCHV